MKNSAKTFFTLLRKTTVILCMILGGPVIVLSVSGNAYSSESEAPATTGTEADPSAATAFEYLMEDRMDPFTPFITESAAASTVDMNEIIDRDIELTGMQLFEPGQLTLVSIMSTGSEKFAMVEDFTGKGYVITEGTKIGRRGVVTNIIPNKVLIEETAETRAGKTIVTKTVMVLKKEGEE